MRILSMFVFVAAVLFASVIYGGHVHDLHPTTPHTVSDGVGTYTRIAIEDGQCSAVPTWDPPVERWELVYMEMFTNKLADKSLTVKVAESRTLTETVAVTWTLGVTGEAEWAAGILLASAKSKLAINVARGQTWTVSNAKTINIAVEYQLGPCKRNSVWKKVYATGLHAMMQAYDHKISCKCTDCSFVATTYCNKVLLDLTAQGYGPVGDTTVEPEQSLSPGECIAPPTMPPTTTP